MLSQLRHTYHKIHLLKNWRQVLHPKALKKRDVVVYLRNGLSFHLRNAPGDLTVLYGIFGNKVYNDVLDIRASAPTIIDIGGHVGMFSALAATTYPHSRVFAFEPDAQNATLFLENMKRNNVADRVMLTEAPVYGERKEITLYVNPSNSSENNMFKVKRGMMPVVLQTTTLFDIVHSHGIDRIDFLKIDCEGAEYSILLSLPESVLSIIDRLAIEWHGYAGYDPKELVEVLEKAGFQTQFVHRPRMIYGKKEHA